MTDDRTWNVFVEGCGYFMVGTTEARARTAYKFACENEEGTIELVHGEQTVLRHN